MSLSMESLIDKFAPGATYVPIRAKMLIDGYCLYERCQRLALLRRKQAIEVFKWANLAAPQLRVDVEVLVDIATSVLGCAEWELGRYCERAWQNKGHSPVQVHHLRAAELIGGSLERRIRDRDLIDVIIDATYEADVFVGASPNLFQIASILRRRQMTCAKGEITEGGGTSTSLRTLCHASMRSSSCSNGSRRSMGWRRSRRLVMALWLLPVCSNRSMIR